MIKSDIQILIIATKPFTRCIIKNQLISMGFGKVLEAENGLAALETIKEKKIDLIISGLNLPGISGLELLRIVRSNNRLQDLPFIMITSETDRNNLLKAVLLKVSELILKPFSQDVFESKINMTMQPFLASAANISHENASSSFHCRHFAT